MRSKSVTFAIASAALLAGSTFAAPALAEEGSRMVTYSDINLESAKGQAVLEERVRRAARQVCEVGAGRSLRERATERACYRLAMQQSQVQVASLLRQNRLGG